MIGAHDTFTYLDCENSSLDVFKKYWRYQSKSIYELYSNYGVRFFDIRVCKDNRSSSFGVVGQFLKKKGFSWVAAHGLVEFEQTWDSLEDLFEWMKTNFPKAQYRLILERSSLEEVNQFEYQTAKWIGEDKSGTKLKEKKYNCSWIGIKNPWKQSYINSELYPQTIHDFTCRLFNWRPEKSLAENVKEFRTDFTIEKYAKKYNPTLTKEQIEDPNTLYFMDYIGKYGITDTVTINDNKFTVKFNDEDTTIKLINGIIGVPVVPPSNPEKEGYRFEGWTIDGTNIVTPIQYIGKDNITYNAVWTKVYSIQFKSKGEIISTITDITGTPIEIPTDLQNEGYQFIGWSNIEDDKNKIIPNTYIGYIGEINITYNAVWSKLYNVEFKYEGTTINTITGIQNTQYELLLQKEGYNFSGWALEGTNEILPSTYIGYIGKDNIDRIYNAVFTYIGENN